MTAPKTKMEPISIIVAVDEGGGFGRDGTIPWNYPADFKHFQKVTKGGVCVMGRRTYEDMVDMKKNKKQNIGSHILPDRQSHVITRNEKFKAEGATVSKNLRQVVHSLKEDDNRMIFVIGGEKLFIEAIAWADKIYMTVVPGLYECDRRFPLKALVRDFKIIEGRKEGDLKFVTYGRKQ